MKLSALLIIPAIMLPLAASAAIADGKALYEKHCLACHASMAGGDGSALFIRPDHRVTSLAGLGRQVRRCRDNLGLTLFDDQVRDIVDYLNAAFYKFPQ